MICLSAIAHGRPTPAVIAAGLALLAVILGVSPQSYASVAHQGWVAPIRLAGSTRAIVISSSQTVDKLIAQDDNDSDEIEVSPGDIERYVAVYKAMQRDRTLTVDQAATQNGLTLQTFRDLESRVERDDAALERARDELQAAAVQASPLGQPRSSSPEK
jgi:hypothetical protein